MAIFPILLGASIAATPLYTGAPVAQRMIYPGAPVVAQPAHRVETPALWVVNDQDTIIYLFGTFHALDGKSAWFEQAVKTAFSASDELVLETVVPKREEPATSSGKVGPSPKSKPVAVVPPHRPMVELAPSASFLATTKLVMTAGRSNGMSTERGADAILRDAADEAGMPVGGLESFGFQLQMFSGLPAGPQKVAPARDPRTLMALAAVLSRLQAAWNRGAVEETFTPLLIQMQTQSPQTYRTMFVERNARWAHWIADRLETPGTVFVAVGTGHLSGPHSVQNHLALLGVKSARIN